MKGNFVRGVYYFWQGIQLILSPGLRRYIVVPVIANFFIFMAIFIGLFCYIHRNFGSWLHHYPSWLVYVLGWLLWIIYWFIAFMIGTFIFTLLTNIIASPFYGFLAEKVEIRFQPSKKVENNGSVSTQKINNSILRSVPRMVYRELWKIIYFIPWLLFCGIFLIFPPAWPALPFIWGLVLAWIMAIQYIDYIADNQCIPLKKMRSFLKKEPLTALGFGGVISLAMGLPLANLFVPPAAVAGGCMYWMYLRSKFD